MIASLYLLWLCGNAASPGFLRVSSASASTPPPRPATHRTTEATGNARLLRIPARSQDCPPARLAPFEGLVEHTLNHTPERSSQRRPELPLRHSSQGQGSRIIVGDSGLLGGGVGVGGETDQDRAGAVDRRGVAERWEPRPTLARRHSARASVWPRPRVREESSRHFPAGALFSRCAVARAARGVWSAEPARRANEWAPGAARARG